MGAAGPCGPCSEIHVDLTPDKSGAALVNAVNPVSIVKGIARIAEYAPDILLVSLGVDTFKKDPISHFKLESEDFTEIGRRIEALGLPTHFVMEGGYAIDEIGVNTVNMLAGFEET